MTEWLRRLSGHRRVTLLFWLLNAAGLVALVAFALRGHG